MSLFVAPWGQGDRRHVAFGNKAHTCNTALSARHKPTTAERNTYIYNNLTMMPCLGDSVVLPPLRKVCVLCVISHSWL